MKLAFTLATDMMRKNMELVFEGWILTLTGLFE